MKICRSSLKLRHEKIFLFWIPVKKQFRIAKMCVCSLYAKTYVWLFVIYKKMAKSAIGFTHNIGRIRQYDSLTDGLVLHSNSLC